MGLRVTLTRALAYPPHLAALKPENPPPAIHRSAKNACVVQYTDGRWAFAFVPGVGYLAGVATVDA